MHSLWVGSSLEDNIVGSVGRSINGGRYLGAILVHDVLAIEFLEFSTDRDEKVIVKLFRQIGHILSVSDEKPIF